MKSMNVGLKMLNNVVGNLNVIAALVNMQLFMFRFQCVGLSKQDVQIPGLQKDPYTKKYYDCSKAYRLFRPGMFELRRGCVLPGYSQNLNIAYVQYANLYKTLVAPLVSIITSIQ